MTVWKIELTNGHHEFDYFLITKGGYIGDDRVRKLIIESELGLKFDPDTWKQYRINNPEYKLRYEIRHVCEFTQIVTDLKTI